MCFWLFWSTVEKTSSKTSKSMWFSLLYLEARWAVFPASGRIASRSWCERRCILKKNAPLCSRLLVFFRSTPRWARKPHKTRGVESILKMNTPLQPFTHFAAIRRSEAPPAAKADPEKAHHSAAICSFWPNITLNVAFEPTETNTKPANQPLNVNV